MGSTITGNRWKSIFEISLVFILVLLIPCIVGMLVLTLLKQIPEQLPNTDYVRFAMFFISHGYSVVVNAVGIALIFVVMALKKVDFSSYGFNLRNLDVSLKIITICVVILFIFYVIQLSLWPVSYRNLINVLLISIVGLFLLLVAIKMVKTVQNKTSRIARYAFLILPVLAAVTMIVMPIFDIPPLSPQLAIIAFISVMFVGVGEETLFRGFFQSRLNEVFGKPYQTFGINWRPGLFVSAVLFSIFHVGNDIPVLAMALMGGLFYGFIKEKTGSIAAPIVIHVTLDYLMYIMASISFLHH